MMKHINVSIGYNNEDSWSWYQQSSDYFHRRVHTRSFWIHLIQTSVYEKACRSKLDLFFWSWLYWDVVISLSGRLCWKNITELSFSDENTRNIRYFKKECALDYSSRTWRTTGGETLQLWLQNENVSSCSIKRYGNCHSERNTENQ